MTQIMLRNARRRSRAPLTTILRYFNVAGADPLGRPGPVDEGRHQPDQGRGRNRARVKAEKWISLGTDYPTPDGTCIRDYIHVCDLVAAHSDALAYLRGAGTSATPNCGYGRGFSVLDVIETVKRVSGVAFKVELVGRRAGDPAHIVAAADRARSTLKWQPHFDDLQTIVRHALAWERKLAMRASLCCKLAGSA